MLAQEAMQVVALDEVEDVGVLRRELQEELEGCLRTWDGRMERMGVQGGGAGCKQGATAAWWCPLWQCSSARASISSGADRTPPGCAAAARATARATVAPAYRLGGHARTRSTRQLSSRLRAPAPAPAPAPVAAAAAAAAAALPPLPSSSESSAASYAPAASCGEATGM